MLRRIGPAADRAGVAVLAADSRGTTWDAIRGGFGDDVAFLNRALEHVFGRLAVDPARVALGGFSDGASYAISLGLANGDLFPARRRVLAGLCRQRRAARASALLRLARDGGSDSADRSVQPGDRAAAAVDGLRRHVPRVRGAPRDAARRGQRGAAMDCRGLRGFQIRERVAEQPSTNVFLIDSGVAMRRKKLSRYSFISRL